MKNLKFAVFRASTAMLKANAFQISMSMTKNAYNLKNDSFCVDFPYNLIPIWHSL